MAPMGSVMVPSSQRDAKDRATDTTAFNLRAASVSESGETRQRSLLVVRLFDHRHAVYELVN
jgi:hypothetical protein